MSHRYEINGTVRDHDTGDTRAGLRVVAWDADLFADDYLGETLTAADGSFTIAFDEDRFQTLLFDQRPDVYFAVYLGADLLLSTAGDVLWNQDNQIDDVLLEVELPPVEKVVRDIYLKIERIDDYNPVRPTPSVPNGVVYKRDCMRFPGHEEGTIPADEVSARAVPALVYREYLDADYLVPRVDKLVSADINEPAYHHRVPGTVIWAHPGETLRLHVLNADGMPHSLHTHGVLFGIDSDGAWPFGTQSADGRRSDEICPGHHWTYTFCATDDTIGVWPFHDHSRMPGPAIDRGLFGAIIVLPPDVPKPPRKRFLPVTRLQHALAKLGKRGAQLDALDRMRHAQQLEWIKERWQLELPIPPTRRDGTLHVPLFFHVMKSPTSQPLWDTGDLGEANNLGVGGGSATLAFDDEGEYAYVCTYHPGTMQGIVRVVPAAPAAVTVEILDGPMRFSPADVSVAPGGTVTWINRSGSHHTATSTDGIALPTHCFNGRGFIGNSPTIVATTGQKIRWYICNLDVGHEFHNFHTHAQRWQLGNEIIDTRGLSPAESFVVETEVPDVLLLPEAMQAIQDPACRPDDAAPYDLRGDFLFHCHVHHHLMNGMGGLVRARQRVWLTPAMAEELQQTIGLPLDDGGNGCPDVDPDRCAKMRTGRIEEIAQPPGVIMMHAALVPNGTVVIFGKDRLDFSRIFHPDTETFTEPNPQPTALPGESPASANLWSAAHAFLADEHGTLLAHGGLTQGAGLEPTKSFLYHPDTDAWSLTGETADPRFYSTSVTLPDGRILTLVGSDGGWGASNTIEVYDPAAGTWSTPKAMPGTFNYLFYPWMYMLPDGEFFIAGPQVPTRKFDWTANPIVDDLAKQWDTGKGTRGSNMNGTSVMLPLRPGVQPRVLIIGGQAAAVQRSVQSIEPMAAMPTWVDEEDLNEARNQCTSTLLPDGRVLVAGGMIDGDGGGGPLETFDPQDPAAGWKLGPRTQYPRLYHSSMILLPDGSVLIGGDDDGADPCERYYPEYYDQPRPAIDNALPTMGYAAAFTIETSAAPSIAEVMLMRPGAVTHGFDMSQRAVVLPITASDANTITVDTPANASWAPRGHYLLFITNGNRVPSVARWVRLQ